MLQIIQVAIGLGILIFIHEFGHFLVAILRGIKVTKFSLGFGPKILGIKVKDTKYVISLLPIGGYVKMAGEDPNEKLTGEKWEYLSQPWWSRILVVVSGPLMNYILGIILFIILFSTGVEKPIKYEEKPIIGDVNMFYPAAKAGIMPDDEVIKINEKEIKSWDEMTKVIRESKEETLTFQIKRKDKIFTVNITPKLEKINGKETRYIGVMRKVYTEYVKFPFFTATFLAVKESFEISKMFVVALLKIIKGELSIQESIGGPVSIGKIMHERAKKGISVFLHFLGLLSINLAIINLFPFPALDGSYIIFFCIEGIRKKPLSIKFQTIVQQIGFAILILLILYVTRNDILRFIK